MFCPNCGNQIPDSSKFCPSCGAAASAPAQPNPTASGSDVPPFPGTAPTQAAYPVPAEAVAAPGMKWFKFIIWVQLFLSALSLLGLGGMLFTGAQYATEYGNARDLVYAFFRELQTVDLIFAVVYVALAACCIVVRMNLAKFKKGAPTQYLALLGAVVVVTVLYVAALMAITHVGIEGAMDASSATQIVASIVMIVLNKIYFDKRAYLFTN